MLASQFQKVISVSLVIGMLISLRTSTLSPISAQIPSMLPLLLPFSPSNLSNHRVHASSWMILTSSNTFPAVGAAKSFSFDTKRRMSPLHSKLYPRRTNAKPRARMFTPNRRSRRCYPSPTRVSTSPWWLAGTTARIITLLQNIVLEVIWLWSSCVVAGLKPTGPAFTWRNW